MKKVKFFAVLWGLVFFVTNCRAPLVSVDPDFKNNSTKYLARLSSNARKVTFGPYETNKAKRRIKSSGTGFFGIDYEKTKEKLDFALMDKNDPAKGSYVVALNMLSWYEFEGLLKRFSIEINRENVFVADIEIPGTAPWAMVVNNANRSFDLKRGKGIGELTDGTTHIILKEIRATEKGGSLLTDLNILGFELTKGDQVIASVQTFNTNYNKKYVWLKNDLADDLKFAIANACAALLLKSNLDKL